jgi:hypothetical protein
MAAGLGAVGELLVRVAIDQKSERRGMSRLMDGASSMGEKLRSPWEKKEKLVPCR